MIRIIAGTFQGRKIKAPKSNKTRPTQSSLRESFFNIVQGKIAGSVFLDLFAGSGAMGFEALSRGAKEAVFVDQNPIPISCVRENGKMLEVEDQITVIKRDALSALNILNQEFDLIFIDPPYDLKKPLAFPEKVLSQIVKKSLLKESGSIFLEVPHLKGQSPLELDKLYCKNVRKYGNTDLMEFQLR